MKNQAERKSVEVDGFNMRWTCANCKQRNVSKLAKTIMSVEHFKCCKCSRMTIFKVAD